MAQVHDEPPVHDEWVIDRLEVEGDVPADRSDLHVRNGPDPLHAPDGRYHAHDGHGMLRAIRFEQGRASDRNRWVRTSALLEERAAGRALLKGTKETPPPVRPCKPLKYTGNTGLKLHAGRLISKWYCSGVPYAVVPCTLDTLGTADLDGASNRPSAPSRPGKHTGELPWLDPDLKPLHMRYGVIGPDRRSCHPVEIPRPGPRLRPDGAVSEHHTVLHDFPLLLDDDAWKGGHCKSRFQPGVPTHFAAIARYGQAHEIRWFEAQPTYLLHAVNAWEENDQVVRVGTPCRLYDDERGRLVARRLERTIHHRQRDCWLHRWRFTLRTCRTSEGPIDDTLNSAFPVIGMAYQGRRTPHSCHAVFPYGGREAERFTGLAKVDHEPGFARDGSRFEDDGYLVTIAWNPRRQRADVQLYDARDGAFGRGLHRRREAAAPGSHRPSCHLRAPGRDGPVDGAVAPPGPARTVTRHGLSALGARVGMAAVPRVNCVEPGIAGLAALWPSCGRVVAGAHRSDGPGVAPRARVVAPLGPGPGLRAGHRHAWRVLRWRQHGLGWRSITRCRQGSSASRCRTALSC